MKFRNRFAPPHTRYREAANIFSLDRDRLLALDRRRFVSIERPRPDIWLRGYDPINHTALLHVYREMAK